MLVSIVKEEDAEAKNRIKELHLDKIIPRTKRQVVVSVGMDMPLSASYLSYSPPPNDYIQSLQKSAVYSTDKPMPKADASKLTGILNRIFAEANKKKQRTRIFCPGQDPNLVHLPHENPIIQLGIRNYDWMMYVLERKLDVRQMYKATRK